jgi:hypothetical protein
MGIFFYLQSQHFQFPVFCLSHQCQRCHNFQYFGQHIETIHSPVIDTDPDRPDPDPDPQTLDANPDPEK